MRRSPLNIVLALVTAAAACLAVLGGAPGAALAADQHRSFLRIGAGAPGTSQQITLGLNKSMIIELPRDVRDVMVSNPEQIEAVLQSSRRAYLIGKKPGEANILFTDKDGNQVATLEVTIERDLSALGDLLNRLLPNSHIAIQTVGERVVLTGTVTSPLNSTRASEIVRSFLGTSGSSGGTANSSGGGAAVTINNSSSGGGGGGGSGDDSGPSDVINMLTVEGREQVLLKVSVVEMERNIVKQFGVDLNALVNSGNFAFAALSDLPFPINVAGKGVLAPFLKERAERGDATPSRSPGRSIRPSATSLASAANGRAAGAACRACSARWRKTACCTPSPSRT